MTGSAQQQVSPQMESIAGALASRVGQRVGQGTTNQPMQLMGNQPQQQQKPQQQAQPTAQGLPPTQNPYGN